MKEKRIEQTKQETKPQIGVKQQVDIESESKTTTKEQLEAKAQGSAEYLHPRQLSANTIGVGSKS